MQPVSVILLQTVQYISHVENFCFDINFSLTIITYLVVNRKVIYIVLKFVSYIILR